jgi:hypothetical protein
VSRFLQLLCIVGFAMMQTGSVTRLPWAGVQLELLPMVLVSFSLRLPLTRALAFALIGGAMVDSFSAGPWGFSALFLLSQVVVLDRLRHVFFLETVPAFFFCGFFAALAYMLCSLGISLVQRGLLPPSSNALRELIWMDWSGIGTGILVVSGISGLVAPLFDWAGMRYLGFPQLRFGADEDTAGAA